MQGHFRQFHDGGNLHMYKGALFILRSNQVGDFFAILETNASFVLAPAKRKLQEFGIVCMNHLATLATFHGQLEYLDLWYVSDFFGRRHAKK